MSYIRLILSLNVCLSICNQQIVISINVDQKMVNRDRLNNEIYLYDNG